MPRGRAGARSPGNRFDRLTAKAQAAGRSIALRRIARAVFPSARGRRGSQVLRAPDACRLRGEEATRSYDRDRRCSAARLRSENFAANSAKAQATENIQSADEGLGMR